MRVVFGKINQQTKDAASRLSHDQEYFVNVMLSLCRKSIHLGKRYTRIEGKQ